MQYSFNQALCLCYCSTLSLKTPQERRDMDDKEECVICLVTVPDQGSELNQGRAALHKC